MQTCSYCGRENKDSAVQCSECCTELQVPKTLETSTRTTTVDPLDTLFVGLKGHVVAFSKRDGMQLWKTGLRSGLTAGGDRFVTVLVDGERIYAHTLGHLFCLDAGTGEKLWSNELAGLGYDIAMLAVVGVSSPSIAALVEQQRRSASASASAAASV